MAEQPSDSKKKVTTIRSESNNTIGHNDKIPAHEKRTYWPQTTAAATTLPSSFALLSQDANNNNNNDNKIPISCGVERRVVGVDNKEESASCVLLVDNKEIESVIESDQVERMELALGLQGTFDNEHVNEWHQLVPEAANKPTEGGNLCGGCSLSPQKAPADSSSSSGNIIINNNNNNSYILSSVELVESNLNCQPIEWLSSLSAANFVAQAEQAKVEQQQRQQQQQWLNSNVSQTLSTTVSAAAGCSTAASTAAQQQQQQQQQQRPLQQLDGQKERQLEVEWTIGSQGRSSFKHALRSSVGYDARTNSEPPTNNNNNNNNNQGASCVKKSLVKSLSTKRSKLQFGGQAIGRTIKNFVLTHLSSSGGGGGVGNTSVKHTKSERVEETRAEEEEVEVEEDDDGERFDGGEFVSELCDSHEENLHEPLVVDVCKRLNERSIVGASAAAADHRHQHYYKGKKVFCSSFYSRIQLESELKKSNFNHHSSTGLIRGSVSCQSLANKLQQLHQHATSSSKRRTDNSALELETTVEARELVIEPQEEEDEEEEEEEEVEVKESKKLQVLRSSNWTTAAKAVTAELAINSKRNSMTSEAYSIAKNKQIIEDKQVKKHQTQSVATAAAVAAAASGTRCNDANSDPTCGTGRERLDERRSTYCSSIGVVTSDLNCDSSFSSVNNCSESITNTCAMQHHHCSSRDFINNAQHQHQQHKHQQQKQPTQSEQQEQTQHQQQPRATSSASDRSNNFINDCNKSPSSNNFNDKNNPGNSISITKKRRKSNDGLKERENWDKNIEFLLAVIGFAVDLGNVWRFPYICYKNGGGAFLIPYTIMFILGGLPIFYLEMSLGQYFSSGCLTVWKRVCPMAKGIGYAMCVLNFFTGLYYNTIISWAVFFFVQSFTDVLPWTSCNNHWNSANCRTIDQRQTIKSNSTFTLKQNYYPENNTNYTPQVQLQQQQVYYSSPTKDYFEREVLQIHLSSGIDNLGYIREPLAIYLAIVFVCIYFAIWKGVKSTGKAVWITALLPYFVLIPLLIRGVFLEGAWLGIKYYLYPQWIKIIDVDVWVEAAKQIYFSLGPGFGTLMALSSYNKFNHNCCRDTLIAASVNYFASFISGLVIFAVLGYMATIENVSISDVATEGPGLVFQVYPEGLATMRFSSMWSVLFFMMVITLGIDSTFGGLESVITGLCDEYPRVLRAHRGIFIGILIVLIYLCSLPTTTYGGNYVIYLLESYGTSLSLLFIVLVETIIVCWLYGADRFCKNLEEMYGEMPGAYWRICWKYISPTILLMIFIAACGQELDKYHTLTNGDYTYPGWAPTVGLLMTGSSVCCIPFYAIYYLKTKVSGSFLQRLKVACKPIQGVQTREEKGEVFSDTLTHPNANDHNVQLDTVI